MTVSEIGCIFFFRRGKSYYFKIGDEIFKLNFKNINDLKSDLSISNELQLRFFGLNRAQISRIVSSIIDQRKCYVRISAKYIGKVKQYIAFLQF